ncbi:hypothetical protein QO058_18510 [Bosea vestrisii]|uniref:hypothetical protein n=1 Tax=Bosea vestrisii TaxID=151416 RepID=UPI0024DFFC05|nr:hypothetical protein [Bosea vestrisii]WID94808.1 hypothetical protein QO058_18510 [Bosea vestrisii]
MTSSVAPVAIIWDGSRHVAAIWRQSAPIRFLAAEEAGGRISLIAAADAGTAPLHGKLPAGSRALHAVTLNADGRLTAIPAQLDERLSLTDADRRTPGLSLMRVHRDADGALALQSEPAGVQSDAENAVLASGFNQASGSEAEGFRLLVGPFLNPEDERAALTQMVAIRSGSAEGLTLSFSGDDAEAASEGLLVAHLPAAMREARQALGQIDQELRLAIETELDLLAASLTDQRDVDATGLGRLAALRRGFRMLRPQAKADGSAGIALPDWVEGDEIIVFAAPRRQLTWAGEGEAISGAPMTLRWQGGAFAVTSHRQGYAASTATELTLGASGGNALVVAEAGNSAPLHDDLALAAGRLADGLWRATSALQPARLATMLDEISGRATHAPVGPFARLDGRAKDAAPASLLDALAATAGIDPARTDELGERTLDEQIAMLLRAIAQPQLARRACAVRLALPLPGTAREEATLERLLAWYEDPNLPQVLAREAMALAGHDRRAMRLLHDVAASAHQGWLNASLATEVEQAVADAAARSGQRRLSPLDTLLLDLRRQPQRQPAPGLEAVARMRSELGEAAQQASQPAAITDELARRLGEVTPGEIILLHGHFAGLRREVEQALAAADLIRAWEQVAGYPDLAARAHRGGDPVRGAQRLTATSRHFAGSLMHVESLAPALAGLTAQIDALLGPASDAKGRSKTLRATLENYSRLLLAQMVLREADAAFAEIPFAARALADPRDTGFGAAYRRLRAGAGDMLPRYLAAAAALTGLDHHWGVALAAGAAATASRQDA